MAQSRFAGREAGLSLDGDVTTGLLGADYAQGPWTGGAVLSHSSGEGGYSGDATGKVEASMTALTPWAGYKVTERLSVWGALGYGTGDLTLTPKNPQTQKDQPAQKTDIAMTLAAAGVRGTLLEGDGPKLDAVADARWARTTSDKVTASAENGGNLGATQADVTRVRLGLEGSWAVALDDEGAAVTPRLSFGVRHDGGDAETGFGADIGGGVTLALPASGLSVSLEGRGLLTHEAKGLSDTGFGGTIAWDPAPSSNRGLSLTLRQSFGGVGHRRQGCAVLARGDGRAGRQRQWRRKPAPGRQDRLWAAGVRRPVHRHAGDRFRGCRTTAATTASAGG